MLYQYSFERLEVWKSCRILVKSIYRITTVFPKDERFGLVSQMRRAVISVGSNIAEGTARRSPRQQAYFYQVAMASLTELLTQLIFSGDLNFTDENEVVQVRHQIERVSNLLRALHMSCDGSATRKKI